MFTTPVSLNMRNFMTEKTLNMSLKLKEDIKDITFTFEQIKSSETTISINETGIIVVATNGGLDRAPYIGMNKLKRSMCYMSRKRKRQLVTLPLLTCITDNI